MPASSRPARDGPHSGPYGVTGEALGEIGELPRAEHALFARWYDPHTGRFVSEDPLGFGAGNSNLEGYVRNNAPNWLDPSGRADVNNGSTFELQLDLDDVFGDSDESQPFVDRLVLPIPFPDMTVTINDPAEISFEDAADAFSQALADALKGQADVANGGTEEFLGFLADVALDTAAGTVKRLLDPDIALEDRGVLEILGAVGTGLLIYDTFLARYFDISLSTGPIEVFETDYFDVRIEIHIEYEDGTLDEFGIQVKINF